MTNKIMEVNSKKNKCDQTVQSQARDVFRN